MPVSTAQDLATAALRLIRVLAPGQTPNPEESAAILDTLNEMIGNWNTEHLAIFTVANLQYQLTAGVQTVTMGPTGDIVSARPNKIESAGIIANGLRQDLQLVSSVQWATIRERGLMGLLPLWLYNDNAYPDAGLNFWPIPGGASSVEGSSDLIWRTLLLKITAPGNDIADHLTVQAAGTGTVITGVLRKVITSDLTVRVNKNGTPIGTITIPHTTPVDTPITVSISSITFATAQVLSFDVLASDSQSDPNGVAAITVAWVANTGVPVAPVLDLFYWAQLEKFAALTSAFDLPPGYLKALRYNLAVAIAPEFKVEIPDIVASIAANSKMDLARLNLSNEAATENPPGAPAQAPPPSGPTAMNT